MVLTCLIDPRSIFHGILAVQDHLYSQYNPSVGLGYHWIHHRRTNVLSRQWRGPEHRRRLCHQRSLPWLDRHLWYCHPPHIRKVRSLATLPQIKTKEPKAHSRIDTPGYRKYSPSSSSLAPPATTSTPPCHPSVPLAQSPPTAAPSSPSNSPSSSGFPPSAPTFTYTTPPIRAGASHS